jgi:cysteine synthase
MSPRPIAYPGARISPALFVYSMIAIGIQRAFRSLTHHPTQASRPFGRWLRRIQSPRMGHSTGGYNPRRLELQSCRDNAMLEISMGRKYQNILETVGNTPVVRINRLAPQGVNLFVKIEAFNPLGSVKDRLALGVIEAAEKSGELKPGQTVIEATSGNTGIGLAMVCAAKGYPLVVTMAEPFSVERRKLMRFLGAKVIVTPAAERAVGMINKTIELAKAHGWFMSRQFENEANPDIHSRTTAREIIDDFSGERLDYWVTGYGTGGTLKGVARVLAKERPDTKIVVCEPEDAQLLASGTAQSRNADGTPAAPHPTFKPHPMQGWTPDFIPKITDDAVAMKVIDRVLPISGPDAIRCSKDLAAQEGIFVGITSGATFAGALKIAAEAEKGANILCMLPDTGERYLSTPLFADVSADMNEEELKISRSTPGAQLNS